MQNIFQSRQGNMGKINGKEVILFSSNDYLGLSIHPQVQAAAKEAGEKFGFGTGGGPGTSGTTTLHEELKEKIANFKNRDKGVLFSSGYGANISLHQALGGKSRAFFVDDNCHLSALDGIYAALGERSDNFVEMMSENMDLTKLITFLESSFNDGIYFYNRFRLEELEEKLANCSAELKIITTPSVYTVHGDLAPLPELVRLKNKYSALLVLDEAHATGCIGKTGRGIEEFYDLKKEADFIMGTFSKALGSSGGFIAYDIEKENYFQRELRGYEHSTTISAPQVAAAMAALDLIIKNPDMLVKLSAIKESIISKCKEEDIHVITTGSMIMLIPCAQFFWRKNQSDMSVLPSQLDDEDGKEQGKGKPKWITTPKQREEIHSIIAQIEEKRSKYKKVQGVDKNLISYEQQLAEERKRKLEIPVKVVKYLLDSGFFTTFVWAKSRYFEDHSLRIIPMLTHTEEHISSFVDALARRRPFRYDFQEMMQL